MSLGTTRKAVLVCVLALAFTVIGAIPAFAGGYVDWSDVATLPGNPTSPHGGYNTATVKCQVCHAVHSASMVGEILLPADVGSACTYCHVNSASGYTQVYDSDEDNYTGTNWPNAHNFVSGDPYAVVKCTICHQVHAATTVMTDNPLLTQKLLKDLAFYDFDAGEPQLGDDKETALTKWCAGCHFYSASGPSWTGDSYYAEDYNLASHIMGPGGGNYSNPQAGYSGVVAWEDSTYCMSCHSSGYGTPAWPHFTPGQRFLESAPSADVTPTAASDYRQDGVCLRCHRDGSGDGVGLTY